MEIACEQAVATDAGKGKSSEFAIWRIIERQEVKDQSDLEVENNAGTDREVLVK